MSAVPLEGEPPAGSTGLPLSFGHGPIRSQDSRRTTCMEGGAPVGCVSALQTGSFSNLICLHDSIQEETTPGLRI